MAQGRKFSKFHYNKMSLNNEILSDITVHMKYARYMPNLKRRETWDELVTRNMNMHLKKFPELELQIRKAYKSVKADSSPFCLLECNPKVLNLSLKRSSPIIISIIFSLICAFSAVEYSYVNLIYYFISSHNFSSLFGNLNYFYFS